MKFKWGKLKKKKKIQDWCLIHGPLSLMVTINLKRVESVSLSPKRRRLWSYSVSNFTASWNPEIAGSLAVFTLSVQYFSIIWHLSPIFQLVFFPNVCISNFILGKLMGKFDEILFCCVKILGYNTLLKFWTILESTTMFLMKKCFAF